jgi:hypothetical protein
MAFVNPALSAFVAQVKTELILAQVLVSRRNFGFELRHIDDRDRPAEKLGLKDLPKLRAMADLTADGKFRPLKSAPNLTTRWIFVARNDLDLELAVNTLYPGAIADWFAAQSATPPVTHYREFTARQTGMYRITTMLTDEQAADVTRACCDGKFCLKRRFWTVPGLSPDAAEAKSSIPCLEPCALLLELARAVTRLEQEKARTGVDTLQVPDADADSAWQQTHEALAKASSVAEADFSSPENPRRLQLNLVKLQRLADAGSV